MTAAAAFLMEISNGGEFRPRRRVLFHNAAAGLCHAGLYEPALKAEELSVSKRESAFRIYIHGNIRFACLYHLARWEEAAREDAKLREILRENPGLTKRKSVQTAIFSMKIKAAIMKQDEKKHRRIWNCTGEQLRIARNEIYARHGRLFIDEELQRHFENCSWYEGKFAPADFSEGLLNEYERANILLMQQYSEEKQP